MTDQEKSRIAICMGSSCFARGNERNLEVIEDFLDRRGLRERVDLCGLRCLGECRRGPNIRIDETLYRQVDSGTLLDLLEEHLGAMGRSEL